MKRVLAMVLATAGILSVASPALANTAYPIDAVNVRSGPGTDYAVIGTLNPGQTADVVAREGSWLRVRTGDGTVGYVADWVTREVYDGPTYVQVVDGPLNLRSGPEFGALAIGRVPKGAQYRALESLNGWYRIDTVTDGTGWITGQFSAVVGMEPAPTPTPAPTPVTPPADLLVKEVQSAANTALYTGRSKEYDLVAPVRAWERLTYVDSAEGWLKVANTSGARGWIEGDEVNLRDRGVDFAMQASYSVAEGDWEIAYLKVREVVPGGTGLVLRAGPSAATAAKRELAAGQRMKLLTIPPTEFVEVMLPDGETGWVSRNWLKSVAGVPAESVRLTRAAPGVVRLELTGLSAPATLTPSATALTVALPENANRRASLTVGEAGVVDFGLQQAAFNVRFDQPVQSRVLEQSDTRLVVEIRPVVQRVERIPGADRETYRFSLTGTAVPTVRRDGEGVLLTVPGALLQSGVTAPAGLTLQQGLEGVTARVVSSRSFAIMQGNGYVDLVLYAAGLAGKIIVLDPGHGGVESGAVGLGGLLEKELNLSVALKLKPLLEAAGARVILTRGGDARCASPAELSTVPGAEQLRYDLNCRAVLSNTRQADLFLSIHANANPSRYERGTETYWSSDNLNAARSQVLAGLVQQELLAGLGLQNRGVRDQIFYVIKYAQAPAALAEMAFVSNSTEEGLLKQESTRQKAAEALFRAVTRFFQ